MPAVAETRKTVETLGQNTYKWGFETDIEMDIAPKGLNEETIRLISARKNEPEWMLEWRLKAYRSWLEMREPHGPRSAILPSITRMCITTRHHGRSPAPSRWTRSIPNCCAHTRSWASRCMNRQCWLALKCPRPGSPAPGGG